VVLTLLIAGCAVWMRRSSAQLAVADPAHPRLGTGLADSRPRKLGADVAAGSELRAQTPTTGSGTRLTLMRRLRWGLLAFVPSSLMLGVTTHLTTDVAAIPLLWVIPLAIYLLSFILVFSSRLPL